MKKVCEPDGGRVIDDPDEPPVTYGFRGTPRTWPNPSEEAAGDTAPMNPHHRRSSALAHEAAGTFGSGNPRRSAGRSSQTPRDGRYGDRPGRPGTLPPVPGRLTPFRALFALLTVFALAVTAFCLLTWQVSAGGRLVADDGRLLRDVRRTAAAHPGYDGLAHLLCDLGDIAVAVPVLLVALVLAARLGRRAGLPRWWVPPGAAALAMCLLPVLVGAVKSGVDRPAPGRVHADPNYGYFPSGHTATSSMAFGLAALVLLPFVRRTAVRALLAAGTVLLALLVGVALVWCDYHWPLDVLASWCLAVALLSAAAAARLVPGAAGRGGGSDEEADGDAGGDGTGGDATEDGARGGRDGV